MVLDLQHEIYKKKNSPKLHFGVTKKEPGLRFHFHVSNLFKCWSNLIRFDRIQNNHKIFKKHQKMENQCTCS